MLTALEILSLEEEGRRSTCLVKHTHFEEMQVAHGCETFHFSFFIVHFPFSICVDLRLSVAILFLQVISPVSPVVIFP
jgi:hypothetical protein